MNKPRIVMGRLNNAIRSALSRAQIPTLQATVDELAAKGGKIKFSACGKRQAQVRQGQYRHGDLRQGGRELHDFRWVLTTRSQSTAAIQGMVLAGMRHHFSEKVNVDRRLRCLLALACMMLPLWAELSVAGPSASENLASSAQELGAACSGNGPYGGVETKDLPKPFQEFAPFIPDNQQLFMVACLEVPGRSGITYAMATISPLLRNGGTVTILKRLPGHSLERETANHTVLRASAEHIESPGPGVFKIVSGWGDGTGNTTFEFIFRYSSTNNKWLLDSAQTQAATVDNDLEHETSKTYTKTSQLTAKDLGHVTFEEFDADKFEDNQCASGMCE
jgi:hypothetical protein